MSIGTYRGVCLFTTLVILLIASTARYDFATYDSLKTTVQLDSNNTGDENGDDIVPPKPLWELLEMTDGMGGVPPSERRAINRIKITFNAKDATIWNVGFVGKKPLVYETDDPRVLHVITYFLSHPLRRAASGRSHGCEGSGFDVGTIEVTTSKDKFIITITRIGFLLGESPDLHTIFYSWGLAHFLDDLCIHKLGVHIPPNIMRHLTGEWMIDVEKKILQRLNEQFRKDLEGAKKAERQSGKD